MRVRELIPLPNELQCVEVTLVDLFLFKLLLLLLLSNLRCLGQELNLTSVEEEGLGDVESQGSDILIRWL